MRVLITGGCGFIGCNSALRFSQLGHQVTVLDNLSRPGSERNRQWLQEQTRTEFLRADIRDAGAMVEAVRSVRPDVLLHLAAQVAVTTSVADPRSDFEINALGTFNVLEALRLQQRDCVLLNASTNKVYGNLSELAIREEAQRYSLPELPYGVGESRPLDFHSPYGCSKGTADQYVIDYGRIYGLRTVNFRQSCIYGTRQFGIEDQGWVAWFTIAHAFERPVTIYGTGKQVRDVLYVDDLVDGYLAAVDRIDRATGKTFNMGGGPANSLSLLELLDLLRQLSGRPVEHSFGDWRPGDQPVFVSDIRAARSVLGWEPRTQVSTGVESLYRWVDEHRPLVQACVNKL